MTKPNSSIPKVAINSSREEYSPTQFVGDLLTSRIDCLVFKTKKEHAMERTAYTVCMAPPGRIEALPQNVRSVFGARFDQLINAHRLTSITNSGTPGFVRLNFLFEREFAIFISAGDPDGLESSASSDE